MLLCECFVRVANSVLKWLGMWFPMSSEPVKHFFNVVLKGFLNNAEEMEWKWLNDCVQVGEHPKARHLFHSFY